ASAIPTGITGTSSASIRHGRHNCCGPTESVHWPGVPMTNRARRVVLITGASSGIGRATADLLAAWGHRVFGGVRAPATTRPLAGMESVPLDVRDEASVKACVEGVRSRAGQIDVVINNAGINLVGAVEETSISQAQALFDTNVIGVLRVIQAVLPGMRRCRSRAGNRLRRHVGRGFALATFPQPGLGSDAARALVVRSDGAGPDLADPARDRCRAAPARQGGERGRVRAAPNAVFNQTDPRAVSPVRMLRSENVTMAHIAKPSTCSGPP